jgi:hypothetical protein
MPTFDLSQEKYIHDVLTKFNMSLCKPVSTPMQIGLKLSNDMILENILKIMLWQKFPILV